ncbi:dTMP kinase [Kineosporia corallincola]|uniref:dTMP kinase n=1 Tax=Kineosporia corallincola TaxID=2835133 RepID=UPI0027DF2951|nr:dTMP kinase [Kineosporia corallincola]
MTASGQHESGQQPGAGSLHADVPEQDHDVAAVLRVPSFRRLWLALAGSSFGDWLGLLATTAMAGTLAGGSYAETNLAIAGVLILRLAPAVLLGPIAGALADRMNRKFVMVAGDVLRGLLFISIPLVGSLSWLYVATVLIEVLALFWGPAKEATVPNLVPRNRLEAANQMSLVTTYGTAPVAALVFSGLSLLNGVLDNAFDALGTNPIDLALYANALTFIVSGLVIARLPIPKRQAGESGEHESILRSIVSGWQFIGATPVVRGLVIGMLGAFAAAGFVIGLAQTYVHDLGAGQPGYGMLFASVFIGLAAGMWAGPRLLDGFSRFRLFGLALITAGGFLAAIALIPNMVMASLLTVGLGACGGIAWVTGYTLLGLTVDDTVRGRTFGFLASASRVVLVLVLALGPGLAAVIGRHTFHFTDAHELSYNGAAFVFLIAAVLVVALGFAAYRQMDDQPGTGLLQDLRTFWSSRRTRPAARAQVAYPGVFVALEGGDGTGKSTQARMLADWLRSDQGHDVVLTREPGATPAGVRMREVLLGNGSDIGSRSEALLFAADRAHHVEAVVRPALARGAVVVTDRYIDSSVAYQGAGRDLDGDEVQRISEWATDGLRPALTVLLDVDPVISKARRARDSTRAGEDRLESEADEFHERVRAEFLALARRTPHRYLVIDAGLAPDQIQQLIREGVRQVLPVSARRRAQLDERLAEEDSSRERRAAAEAEVLRMDADLRRRRVEEAREREESRRRARDEAERQLQQEAERELRAQESQRNREEVDRRASAAAAAAALGPVTEPVQMPGRLGGRRAAPPSPASTSDPDPQQMPPQDDLWGPPVVEPADPTVPVRPVQPEPPQQYEGDTSPVPQTPRETPRAPQHPAPPTERFDLPEQDLQAAPPPASAPPRTIHLPDDAPIGDDEDRTITLPDSETGPIDTGAPGRRRGRRQA